jgi:hypothetical protein
VCVLILGAREELSTRGPKEPLAAKTIGRVILPPAALRDIGESHGFRLSATASPWIWLRDKLQWAENASEIREAHLLLISSNACPPRATHRHELHYSI